MTPRGFTLLELMVTIAIVAILAAVGVPSFVSLIASQKLKTAASTLQASLNLTRAEALKRNANVTLSPRQAGQWNAGWQILDPSTSVVLFTTEALSSLTITGPASVVYQGSGRVSAAANTTFKFSSTASTDIRCVEVDLSGIGIVTTSGC